MKNVPLHASLILSLLFGHNLKAQYQLNESLSAPYVQSIKASATEDSFAWVVNEAGVRNIWWSSGQEVEPLQITNFTEDDGLDISSLIISGKHIFFLRGNGKNRDGYPANPASLPEVPNQLLLRVSTETQKVDTISMAGALSLSADGNNLLVNASGSVMLLENIGEEFIMPQQSFQVRSGATALEWSPDGSKVAFVSERGDHSFVGYYSFEDNKVNWIVPEFSYDRFPVWSPSGEQIAFIRTPGQGQGDLRNIMGGEPFKVMVADLSTGKAESIWQSPADDGGFSQYYPEQPLKWTKSGKILFYSEHDGWMHIYSINPEGSGLTDLTPGSCEVENYDLSTDEKQLFFTSNCDDINRRHIWKVSVSGGQPAMITPGAGIQTHPVALQNGALAFMEGLYNRPTVAVYQKGNDKKVLGKMPESYPADDIVEPKAITFKASDGLTIHGQLFLPKGKKIVDRPAVIFMHGGPIRQMLLGYHYSGYYANAYIFNQYLASQGYVVLSVNFRDGIGYGRDFRRAENQGPRGAAEYKDILAAGKYLQSLEEVDPEKIGLWGGSYGGYLTAMGLAKNSDMFKAGVDLHGVHDWSWRARDFSPGGAWGISKELMDVAYHSSPISELQYWRSPVLLISGDDDRNVMFGQSIDLKNRLDELGVYNESLVFPDEVHGFLRYDSWLRAYEAGADFFDRFLK